MPTPQSTPARVALFDNAYSSTLAFLTSLGEHGVPVDVYGSTAIGTARWSRYCTHYRCCPPLDQPQVFLPWLRQQIRSGAITRVAPTSDLLAFYLAELRDEFADKVKATIAPLGEIENCLIKTRFTAICSAHGIAVPATAAPTTLAEALAFAERVGYPLMLKAKSHLVVGMAERGTVIHDAAQLQQHFRPYQVFTGHEFIAARYPELRLPLLQQFVPSATQRVYSVSGFKDARQGVVTAALSYKSEQSPPQVGTSTHQVGCNDQRILQTGIKAVEQLLSCGIFELELLADGDALLAIDLNPRAFGFMHLDIARGSDLPWLWFQSTQGNLSDELVPRPLPEMESRRALSFYVSRLVGLLRAPQRRQQLVRLREDWLRPWISMNGRWRDPVPKMLLLLAALSHPRSLFTQYWRQVGNAYAASPMAIAPKVRLMPQPGVLAARSDTAMVDTAVAVLEHLATGAHPRMVFTRRSVDRESSL